MRNTLFVAMVALLTGCVAAPGSRTTSPRTAASAARPAQCVSYRATCTAGCAPLAAPTPNPGACPVECTPSIDGTLQVCAASASCTMTADAARTHEYHMCLASCATGPDECR